MHLLEELDFPHYIDKELLEDYWLAEKVIEKLNPSGDPEMTSLILDFHRMRKERLERILLRQNLQSEI